MLVLLFTFTAIEAQNNKINFGLKSAISKAKTGEQISLFVAGDVAEIKRAATKLGGITQRAVGNYVQVKLPANKIESFAQNPFVDYIEYNLSGGEVLNDTMLVHNNIINIHNGENPLPSSYTGKNVILGFIDTGIDLDHPDFKDTLGNTRILAVWDQFLADDGSSNYGYGQICDSAKINAGTCGQTDHNGVNHGTHVAGIAAGNGLGVGDYTGAAPESNIVMVASNQGVPNWLSTVVDAVEYIYDVADSYNMPCVINVSMGTYMGSHDGTDATSLLIDSLVKLKPGRAFVSAAGNAGTIKLHLEHQVTSDTTFTWFKYNGASALGYGSVFYELWADTVDFNNVHFAVGANLASGSYEERGSTQFYQLPDILGFYTDTIKNDSNQILGIVDFYSELQGDKYLMQVHMQEPDSNQLLYSFKTTGSGRLDIWSTSALGISEIVDGPIPDSTTLPEIVNYVYPDVAKTMVSSFQNHPDLLAVANFVNRATYLDVDTILRSTGKTPGEKAASSSWGPTRRGAMKPDIGATGDYTIGPVSAGVVAASMGSPSNRQKIALGGMHRFNGGTSMASPVVAGVAALYLEKCPTATQQEIMAAIMNTAKQDAFTGTVPNTAFGAGKIDGLAVMNTSNFNVTLGDDLTICDGDSVAISPGNYTSYNWSNGDTTQTVYEDTSATYFVTVTNASGCIAQSDTLATVWQPLPTKPVVTVNGNDSLLYSTNLDLQWYLNTDSISGANDTLWIAQSNGDYFVQVADTSGCSSYSDTVNIILLNVADLSSTGVEFYPNPSKNNLYINLTDDTQFESVELITMDGKVVKRAAVNSTTLSVNVEDLSAGVYYVKLASKENSLVQKVIISR